MGRLFKILTNVDSVPHSVIGKILNPGETYEIPPHKWLEIIDDDTLKNNVSEGKITVNDGDKLLSSEEGRELVEILAVSKNIVPKTLIFPYAFAKEMNYSQYLVSWVDNDTQSNRLVRSGDECGLKWGSSSPILCPVDGTITSVMLCMKAAAVSDKNNVESFVNILFEVWHVGFDDEGTKKGQFDYNINSSQNPIGKKSDTRCVDTNLFVTLGVDIPVSYGDRLALKFIRQLGDDVVSKATGVFISLTVLETL